MSHQNAHCECPVAGWCQRHSVNKTERQHQLCRGIGCTAIQSKKYWDAWEAGRMDGQLAAVAAPQEFERANWDVTQRSRGMGDVLAKLTSKIGIKPCGGCKGRQAAFNNWFPFKYTDTEVPEFVTTARLMDDVKKLVSGLPPNTSEIIGIARSGVCVAGMVAMLMHRPLSIYRQSQGDLIPGGNGWRLMGNTTSIGPAVVIDDTVMTGNSFKQSLPVIRQDKPTALAAAVYVNPAAKVKPDIWVHDLPWPHVLEWNLFNSIMTPALAVDFDGILCCDCPPGSDDDGPQYLEFLRNTPPRYYVRKGQIPMIVTARLEKYRAETLGWLARSGMSVDQLVMGPWADHRERARADVAAFKSQHFDAFRRRSHRIQPPMFVESDERLARRIAELSRGGVVVCPAAGKCFKS